MAWSYYLYYCWRYYLSNFYFMRRISRDSAFNLHRGIVDVFHVTRGLVGSLLPVVFFDCQSLRETRSPYERNIGDGWWINRVATIGFCNQWARDRFCSLLSGNRLERFNERREVFTTFRLFTVGSFHRQYRESSVYVSVDC